MILAALLLAVFGQQPLPPGATGSSVGSGPVVAPPVPVVPPPARSTMAPPRGLDPLITSFEGAQVERIVRMSADGDPLRANYVRSGTQIDHGPDVRWHSNGVVAITRTWREGRQDRLTEEWFESGFKKSSVTWVADLREGIFTMWYEDGAPRMTRVYAGGLQSGTTLELWTDGSLKSSTGWRNGRFHGESVQVRSGRVASRGNYSDGQRDGAWEEFDAAGRVLVRGLYQKGKEQGPWIRHDESGARIDEEYEGGQLQGVRRVTAVDGTVLGEGAYRAGKAHGVAREWFAAGAKKSEQTFVDGVQDGPVRYWFETGGLQIEGTMKAGKREGTWTYWKSDGSRDPEWSGTYRDDKRISE